MRSVSRFCRYGRSLGAGGAPKVRYDEGQTVTTITSTPDDAAVVVAARSLRTTTMTIATRRSSVGQNILFVVSDAMIRDNATGAASGSGNFLEVWPTMYIALARSLAQRGHQCHFVVSCFDERGRGVRAQLERASMSVTAVQKRRHDATDLSSAIAREAEAKSNDSSFSSLPDLEMGMGMDAKAADERETVSAFFERNFVDEALRLLMACADFRPTLIVTGEAALHLAVPAGLKHDAPLILIETSGPVLAMSSKYKKETSQLRKCHNLVYLHQSLRQKKQLRLANLLIKCLGLGKPVTSQEWKRIAHYVKRMYLTSELNFCQENALSSLRDLTSGGGEGNQQCFDFLFGASYGTRKIFQRNKSSRAAIAAAAGEIEEEDPTHPEAAIVPAELESPDSSHKLSQSLSGFSLEQFLAVGAPVIGIWIDAQGIASQLGARTAHQVALVIKEVSQVILGALADLQYKGLILHYSEEGSECPGSSQYDLGSSLLDDASLLAHSDILDFAEENVKEIKVRSPEEAIKHLSRCKAIIHNGTLRNITAVSHLGIPSLIIPTPYFASQGPEIDYKVAQLALQEHHLARTLQALGTAAVTCAFGSLSRLVLANQVRRIAQDEGMNSRAVTLAIRLEAKDSLRDAVVSVEDTVSKFCSAERGGQGSRGGGDPGSAMEGFSYKSSDDLQREGVTSGTVKYSTHSYSIPYALRLEWTVRDGEDKFRFNSLKGHGQLA